MALNSQTSSNLVKTALDNLHTQAYDYEMAQQYGLATSSDSLLFKQNSSDSQAVIYEEYSGTGYFQQRATENDELSGYSPRATNTTTLTNLEFTQFVDVPRNFMQDDKWGTVARNVQEMARSARRTQDQYNVNRFALGFTTQDVIEGTSSVDWFSNSHTTIDGTTVDNLETGAFTSATLEATIVSLGRQIDQAGKLGYHHARVLFVPENLLKEATEAIDSDFRYDTGNNAVNYLSRKFPGLEMRYSPFLDTTSTTAYFVAGENHNNKRWVREGIHTNYISWDISANWVGKYQSAFREVTAPVSFAGIVGSTGA